MKSFTVEEIAAILKCSAYNVRKYLRDGDLKGFKIGGKNWRVTEDSLNEYMKRGA